MKSIKTWLSRVCAVVVIALLVALAFAPSINANVSKEYLTEVTTEFCGLGKKHTVQLTQEQVDEVDKLFDGIKLKLDNVESTEETLDIYKEAIVKLNKYGLLGDLSVRQAQRLVTGMGQSKIIERISNIINQQPTATNSSENYLCLIAGQTTYTFFQTWLSAAILMSAIPLELLFFVFYILLRINLFPIISTFILNFIANLGSYLGRLVDVTLAHQPLMFGVNIWLSQSNGWVRTIGLKGIQKIDGYFNGKMLSQSILDEYFKAWIYGYTDPNEPTKAVKRFIGLRINLDNEYYESFYIGTALAVKLGPGN